MVPQPGTWFSGAVSAESAPDLVLSAVQRVCSAVAVRGRCYRECDMTECSSKTPFHQFVLALRYLVDVLQESSNRIFASAEPEEVRKGVILFLASAVQGATELTRVAAEPIAGWLVARTLWHNAGC